MTEVAKLDQIPDGGGISIDFEGDEVALFREGDNVYAIDAICPHVGGNLAEGDYSDGVAVCPLHGWEINVREGKCETTGEDHRCYQVEVKDGAVFIQ